MRKVILMLLLSLSIHAESYTLELYEKLLSPLVKHRPIIIYADPSTRPLLERSRLFEVHNSCDDSVDFLIGDHFETLPSVCQTKPRFTTTYRGYTQNSTTFGAFYWRKGRPQIHFKRTSLKRFSLSIPEHLERFVEEEE